MAWETLPTDYKDVIWEGLKKYTQIDNADGTISFRDDTTYINKEESFFSAKDANQMNEAMNYIMAKLEKGTDLYTAFKDFFREQKILFAEKQDENNEQMQERFNKWFETFKSNLSGDAAGKLQNQIDKWGLRTDGFIDTEVEFSSDGKTITEKSGDKKITTEFVSQSEIIQKLYANDDLILTKTIKFLENGKKVKEVIS